MPIGIAAHSFNVLHADSKTCLRRSTLLPSHSVTARSPSLQVKASAGLRKQAACLSYISTLSFKDTQDGLNPSSTIFVAAPNFVLKLTTDREDLSWQQAEAAGIHPSQRFAYLPDLQYHLVVLGHGCETRQVDWEIIFVAKIYTSPQKSRSSPRIDDNLQNVAFSESENWSLPSSLEKVNWSEAVEGVQRRRRLWSLILFNVLAALYGTEAIVTKFLEGSGLDGSPLPASFSSLVRSFAALTVFLPALRKAFHKIDPSLIKAGAELGGYLFAAALFESFKQKSAAWSNASVLFALSVIFVPLMEISGGRSVSRITWMATIAALLGMGLLQEEGSGWNGICLPQLGDLWRVAGSLASALHIVRSEAVGARFDAFLLNAAQLGMLTGLSLVWEVVTLVQNNTGLEQLNHQVSTVPWGALLYGGLVCSGLCSFLELRGLRWVHASTTTLIYTTIPMWGALFSYMLRNEVSAESAFLTGWVVLVGGLFARWLARRQDVLQLANKRNVQVDRLPQAFLTSQLKFPYYAAQAQKLLAEAKFKVGAAKSMLLIFLGSSNGPGTGTAGSSVHLVPSPDQIAHAAASVHLGDFASAVTMGLVSGLDSAAVALGSDLVQAVEEAEDAASLAGDLLNAGVGNVYHAASMLADNLEKLLDTFPLTLPTLQFLHHCLSNHTA